MTKDEALKLALEVLEEGVQGTRPLGVATLEAIATIKEALAQPEQEPVAWVDLQKEAQQIVESKVLWKRFIDGTPLANDIACWMADFAQQHTTPPQRKPLTDEEIAEFAERMEASDPTDSFWREFARAIEAAHGIKE